MLKVGNQPSVWLTEREFSSGESLIISSTMDYGRFKIDVSNRSILPGHVEVLKKAIAVKNLLREFPIVVAHDFTVIDGQHRLAAAQALGVPIFYVVSASATIRDVGATTAAVCKWKTEDYMRYWCSLGAPEYLKLAEFWKANNFLFFSRCLALCHHGDIVAGRIAFREGNYQTNNLPFANLVVRILLDFSRYTKLYQHDAFVGTIGNLADNALYDHKRMMTKMEYQSAKLVKCPNLELYMKVINEIYNYKALEKDRVELKFLNATSQQRKGGRAG